VSVATLSPDEYDALERAIVSRRRIAVIKHGMELVVLPEAILQRPGGEVIEARHPSTGERIVFNVADLDGFEVVTW
jgi:hypothetical protein